MKIKEIIMILLVVFVIYSCAPITTPTLTQTPVPNETLTSIPIENYTPIPPTPTIMRTMVPENLADAKDLPIWINEYVHAYGGKVTINGEEVDANQLTDEIHKNAERFTQIKEINGFSYLFLVVNGAPLAIQDENGKWQEATIKIMSVISGVHFNISGIYDERDLMKKHFTSYSSQWAFIWNVFRSDSKEKYNFDRTDYDIKFAQDIGADNINIFHLIWGWRNALPDWLVKGAYTNDELVKIMTEHIQKTVSRYTGKVAAWSVVNEPFGSSNTPGNSSFWGDKLGNDIEKGTEWIGTAFKVAHENDPNAKLFLNDTGIEFSGYKSDKIFTLVKTLKEQGYPIDGIGFQMHLSGYNFLSLNQRQQKIKQFTSQIQRYRDIGIEVRITELDIAMNGISGTSQEKQRIQFDIYKAIVDTGLKEGVKEFTIFGVRDEQSWLISTYGLKDPDPSLFNNQGKKPAYYAITQSLFEFIH